MPVALLLCEGVQGGRDARVLTKILNGISSLAVHPAGGAGGMGDRVRIVRQVRKGVAVAGIRDRDFDDGGGAVSRCPRKWESRDGKEWFGWYWERKEIENYLIDPDVVVHALADQPFNAEQYAEALREAADSIAYYTAARTALAVSRSRVRYHPMADAWGKERGRDEHTFPTDLSDAACQEGIRCTVGDYHECQGIPADEVVTQYKDRRQECLPGGQRHTHYLTFFAGKDLLYALEPHLRDLGLESPGVFCERVLKGIERAADAFDWLPEWQALRSLVEAS